MSKEKLTYIRSGVHYTDFYVDGKRIRKKLGRMDKASAQIMAEKIKESMVGGSAEPTSVIFGMLKVSPDGGAMLDKEGFLTLRIKWNAAEILKSLKGKKEFFLEVKGIAK